MALRIITDEGGFMIYHFGHEGRGIGFTRKIAALELMDRLGISTFEASRRVARVADARGYDAAIAILADLGVTSVRLLTNNPDKCRWLEAAGIQIDDTRRLIVRRPELLSLLDAKRRVQGHLIDKQELQGGCDVHSLG